MEKYMNKPPSEHDDGCDAARFEPPHLDSQNPSNTGKTSEQDEPRRKQFLDALERTGKRYEKAFVELAK